MYRKLPPISMLRTFEAAARMKGYSLAAKELYITHSAVSQHIRALEQHVGYSLFQRSGNAMLLTEPGKRLAEDVRRILNGLTAVFPDQKKRHDTQSKMLTLEVMAPIAENWLIPRLESFNKLYPDIVLNIRTTPDLVPLEDESADISLRYGDGSWRGVQKIKLRDEWVFPACSPEFLNAHPDISLQNLRTFPLIRHSVLSWGHWFEKAGLPAHAPENALTFNEVTHIVRAALLGQGIALVRYLLAKDHLESGRLVRLFDISTPGTYSYYVAWRQNDLKEPTMSVFRNWVISEMSRDSDD